MKKLLESIKKLTEDHEDEGDLVLDIDGKEIETGSFDDLMSKVKEEYADQYWTITNPKTGEIIEDAEGNKKVHPTHGFNKGELKEPPKPITPKVPEESYETSPPALSANVASKIACRVMEKISNTYPDLDPSDCFQMVMDRFNIKEKNYPQITQEFEKQFGTDIYGFYDSLGEDMGHPKMFEMKTIKVIVETNSGKIGSKQFNSITEAKSWIKDNSIKIKAFEAFNTGEVGNFEPVFKSKNKMPTARQIPKEWIAKLGIPLEEFNELKRVMKIDDQDLLHRLIQSKKLGYFEKIKHYIENEYFDLAAEKLKQC